MFSRKACAISGNDSAKICGSKNAFFTSGQPGEVTMMAAIAPKKTIVLAVAMASERVPPSPPSMRERRLPGATGGSAGRGPCS